MNSDVSGTVYLIEEDLDLYQEVAQLLQARSLKVEYCRPQSLDMGEPSINRPCVVVVDLAIGMKLPWLWHEYRQERRVSMPTIFVTNECDVHTAVKVMESGAITVQFRPIDSDKLAEYIDTAFQEYHLQSLIDQRYLETKQCLEELTSRQRSVLIKVAQGKTTKQIANELDVSVRLIEQERSAILRQFRVVSTPEVTVKIGEFRALQLLTSYHRFHSMDWEDIARPFFERML